MDIIKDVDVYIITQLYGFNPQAGIKYEHWLIEDDINVLMFAGPHHTGRIHVKYHKDELPEEE